MKFMQNFITAPSMYVSRAGYLALRILIFIQQLCYILRFAESEQVGVFLHLVQCVSLCMPYANSDTLYTIQYVAFGTLNACMIALTMALLLCMFCVHATPNTTSKLLQAYFYGNVILLVPLANINLGLLPSTALTIAAIVLQVAYMIVHMIFSYSVGQEFCHAASIQMFNQMGHALDHTMRFVVMALQQNITQPGMVEICLALKYLHFVLAIVLPLQTDIYLYPVYPGFLGIETAIQTIVSYTGPWWLRNALTITAISIIIFVLVYYLTQYRMTRTVEGAIRWLILRRQHVQQKDADPNFDIDYFYPCPPFYLQLLHLVLLTLSLPIRLAGILMRKSGDPACRWVLRTAQRLLRPRGRPDRTDQVARLMWGRRGLMARLVYSHYIKAIGKRVAAVNGADGIVQAGRRGLNLGLLTAMDYNLVVDYIAAQYVHRRALELFEGRIAPDPYNREPVDLQYLKHLQVIAHARYPRNRYIKLVYSIVLAQVLDDYSQAELQLRFQRQLQRTEAYSIQLRYNLPILHRLFSGCNLQDEILAEDRDDQSGGAYGTKVVQRIAHQLRKSPQEAVYDRMNELWDDLDRKFVELWDGGLGLTQLLDFYRSYLRFINQVQRARRTSNNADLYDTYQYAVGRYFNLQTQSRTLHHRYVIFRNKYADGQDILIGSRQGYQIINHYNPSAAQLKMLYNIEPQIALLSRNYMRPGGTIAGQVDGAIDGQNSQTSQYGPNRLQRQQAAIKMFDQGIVNSGVPMSLGQAVIFIIGASVALLIALLCVVGSACILYADIQHQISSEHGLQQSMTDLQFLHSYRHGFQLGQTLVQGVLDKRFAIQWRSYMKNYTFNLVSELGQYSEPYSCHTVPVGMFESKTPLVSLTDIVSMFQSVMQRFPSDIAERQQLAEIMRQYTAAADAEWLSSHVLHSSFGTYATVVFLVGFASPVLVLVVRELLLHAIERDFSYMASLFQHLPTYVRRDTRAHYQMLSTVRQRFTFIYRENIFQFLKTIITGNYAEGYVPLETEHNDIQNLNCRQHAQLPKQQRKTQHIAWRYYNKLILVVIMIIINIISCAVLYDKIAFHSAMVNQNMRYHHAKGHIFHMQQYAQKIRVLQKYFAYEDLRLRQLYSEVSRNTIHALYQRLDELFADMQLYQDVAEQCSIAHLYMLELERLGNISLCLHDLQTYNNCSQDTMNEAIQEMRNPDNLEISFTSPANIVNSEYANFLLNQTNSIFKYITVRLSNAQSIVTEENIINSTITKYIIRTKADQSKISTEHLDLIYAPGQYLNLNQYVNTMSGNGLSYDSDDIVFIHQYLNASNTEYSTLEDTVTYSITHNQPGVLTEMTVVQCVLLVIKIIILFSLISQYHSDRLIVAIITVLTVSTSLFNLIQFYGDFDIQVSHKISLLQQHLHDELVSGDNIMQKLAYSSDYDEELLRNALSGLYKFHSLYMFSDDDYAIRLGLNDGDLTQRLIEQTLFLPLNVSMKENIRNIINQFIIQRDEQIIKLNSSDVDNTYVTAIFKLSHYIQQYLKISYKALGYYCHRYQSRLSPELYNSSMFMPVRRILEYDQGALEILLRERKSANLGLSQSPTQYSSVNIFMGLNVFSDDIDDTNQARFLLASYEYALSRKYTYTMLEGYTGQLTTDLNFLEEYYTQQLYMVTTLCRAVLLVICTGGAAAVILVVRQLFDYVFFESLGLQCHTTMTIMQLQPLYWNLLYSRTFVVGSVLVHIAVGMCLLMSLDGIKTSQEKITTYIEAGNSMLLSDSLMGAFLCELNPQGRCFYDQPSVEYFRKLQLGLQKLTIRKTHHHQLWTTKQSQRPDVPDDVIGSYLHYMFSDQNNTYYDFTETMYETDYEQLNTAEQFVRLIVLQRGTQQVMEAINASINDTKLYMVLLPGVIAILVTVVYIIILLVYTIRLYHHMQLCTFFRRLLGRIPSDFFNRLPFQYTIAAL